MNFINDRPMAEDKIARESMGSLGCCCIFKEKHPGPLTDGTAKDKQAEPFPHMGSLNRQ